MLTLRVRNHQAYQRGALLLIATGAATAWACAGTAGMGAQSGRLLLTVVAIVAAALAHRQARSLWVAAAVATAAVMPAFWLWPQLVHAGSWVSGFAVWVEDPAGPAGQAATGALFGLVSSVGLLSAHLGRSNHGAGGGSRAERFAAAGGQLDRDDHALCARALRAHARITAEMVDGGDAPAARRLAQTAAGMTDAVLGLALRASQLRRQIGDWRGELEDAVRSGPPPGRTGPQATLTLASGGAHSIDSAALTSIDGSGVAGDAGVDLLAHLFALDAAADRLRDRVRLHVLTLERTALALLSRRASGVAGAVAALAPLSEQLEEAAEHVRHEANALSELSSGER